MKKCTASKDVGVEGDGPGLFPRSNQVPLCIIHTGAVGASQICVFVRASISLAIVRSNSLLLRGPFDKGARIQQQPELTDGALMVLLTHWQDKIKGRPQGTTG